MHYLRLSLLLFSLVCWTAPALANECSKEDRDYADFWDNYYVPEEARAFGMKIQRLVLNKDLPGMFSLVEGELQNGPRKSFVANKSFQEVFDDSWVDSVLSDEAPCSPVGWRGFMLGNGMIWYNKSKSGWEIFSINGAAQEAVEKPLGSVDTHRSAMIVAAKLIVAEKLSSVLS